MRGKLLGSRYRIQSRLGEGGMAFVYIAQDEKLGRKVAVKILHQHLAENEDLRKRFYNEAHAISNLDHPNILKIYDFSGEQTEDLWIVTEFLKGLNLNDYAAKYPGHFLHPIVATCIVREILKALNKAHIENVIHRDIKPENIMVLNDGKIKLMDFGIAKNMRSNSMTMTGTFMGSPSYMSPEQIRGKAVDNRSDLYSLGVLFYEIVTGKLPYTGSTTHDVVMKICEGKFKEPKIYIPNLPDDLNNIIVKAISKQPGHRYQEARTFARDLDIFLGKHNFEESHIELERYFNDRDKFEQRLRKLEFTNKATIKGDVKSNSNKPQRKPLPIRTTKTQKTVHLDPEEQLKIALQKKNTEALNHPKPATKYGWKQPNWNKSPQKAPKRRDRAINPKLKPPHVTKKHRTPQPQRHQPPPTRTNAVVQPSPQLAQQRPGQLNLRRSRPRVPKRRTQPMMQRITVRPKPRIDLVGVLIGTILVALVGGLAIWGFWNLNTSISQNKSTGANIEDKTSKSNPSNNQSSNEKDATTTTSNRKSQSTKAKNRAQSPTQSRRTNQPRTRQPKAPNSIVTPRTPTFQKRPTSRLQKRPTTRPTKQQPLEVRKSRSSTNTTPDRSKQQPKPVVKPARIKLSSRPAAEVYVDGKRVATTVDRTTSSGWITVGPGKHVIELRRTGYQTYVQNLNLESGGTEVISGIDLKPSSTAGLTIRSSHYPLQIVILNLSDQSRKVVSMRSNELTQSLPSGRYKLRFIYREKVIERSLILSGYGSQSLTVDFSGR